MAEVKILVEGYASQEKNVASSSCVLITENGVNVIVDPGVDRPKLLDSLKETGLTRHDINYVIQSHGHIDHCGLIALFENAVLFDFEDQYTFEGGFKSHDGKIPGTGIEIIKTPGHDPSHCSVLVDTKEGKVVVAEDVFWWWDEEPHDTDQASLMNRVDPYVKDEAALKDSRRKVLEIADYIIPGHGKMFKVEK